MSSSSLLRLFLVGLAALTVCLTSTPAFAGEQEAKEFYSQAKDAYQAGDFARAADLLERAYAEDPNLIYQYNRILALQGMEKYKEALRVLDIYENPMKEDGRFDDVAEIRAQLEEAIAEQTGDDAQATSDTSDEDPTAEASSASEASGTADEGKPDDEDVQLDDTRKRDRIVGWSLVGAGAAAAIAGSPFYTKSPDNLNDDELGTYRTISIVTISSAVVLSGAGAYFLYRGYSGESSASASHGESGKFFVSPYVTTEGGGGSLLLRF
jgi:tetratricopeptide (TPR) repeat protein